MKKKILQKISLIKKRFRDKKINLHEPTILKDDIKNVVNALKKKGSIYLWKIYKSI